jgi:hypothetical protein
MGARAEYSLTGRNYHSHVVLVAEGARAFKARGDFFDFSAGILRRCDGLQDLGFGFRLVQARSREIPCQPKGFFGSAPRLAGKGSTGGDRVVKNSEIRAEILGNADAHRLCVDRHKQLLHGARGRCTKAFVEINGLGVFLADDGVLLGKGGLAGERFLDAPAIARIQRADRVPGQQHFYLAGPLLQDLVRRHYGQPCFAGCLQQFG